MVFQVLDTAVESWEVGALIGVASICSFKAAPSIMPFPSLRFPPEILRVPPSAIMIFPPCLTLRLPWLIVAASRVRVPVVSIADCISRKRRCAASMPDGNGILAKYVHPIQIAKAVSSA